MEFGGPRKRGRHEDSALNGNGAFKKSRSESESFPSGVGSKSKPCTKFFSTSGCPFGEGCHFLHYMVGGYKAVSNMMNLGNSAPVLQARSGAGPSPFPDASAGKSKMCSKYNTSEGCRFGDKCHFAHGEWELGGRPSIAPHEDPRGMMGPMSGRMGAPPQHGFGGGAAGNFGASATAKISIDSSLAGAIIGKAGANSKQICRVTGVKLAIRDHESDPNLRNIELEGTFDQIKQASTMVRELIGNVKADSGIPVRRHGGGGGGGGQGRGGGGGGNFKSKLCENFAKGSCTFGDKCNFAHGADELIRKTEM